MSEVKKILGSSFVNLVLRSTSVLLKFFLVIIISKEFSVNDLGVYNIFASSVAVIVFLVGFEFHYYNTKKIVEEGVVDATKLFYNQFVFTTFCTLITVSILYFTLFNTFLPEGYFFVFSLVLYFDLLSQEVARILIAYYRSVLYNLIFFIKSGFWVIVVIIESLSSSFDLLFIFYCWMGGVVLAFFFSIFSCYKIGIFRLQKFKVSIEHIKLGVLYAYPFLLSVVFIRLINFSDRFFIDYFLGKESVGVYAFYIGIASVPTTLISSGISVQFTPRLLNNKINKEYSQFIKNVGVNVLLIFSLFGLFYIVSFYSIDYLLGFVSRKTLIENEHLLNWVILANFFLSLSTVGHSILYCFNKRHRILYISIFSFVVLCVLELIFIPQYNLLGAAMAIVFTYFVYFVLNLFSSSNSIISWIKEK